MRVFSLACVRYGVSFTKQRFSLLIEKTLNLKTEDKGFLLS